jgi:hypothetical protein
MRLYRRDAFLALPPGVVYCQGERWIFTRACIKDRTIHDDLGVAIDWLFLDPQDIDAESSAQREDRYDDMAERGVSYPLNTLLERDGMFNPDDFFLVYEADDLRALIALLDKAPSPS